MHQVVSFNWRMVKGYSSARLRSEGRFIANRHMAECSDLLDCHQACSLDRNLKALSSVNGDSSAHPTPDVAEEGDGIPSLVERCGGGLYRQRVDRPIAMVEASAFLQQREGNVGSIVTTSVRCVSHMPSSVYGTGTIKASHSLSLLSVVSINSIVTTFTTTCSIPKRTRWPARKTSLTQNASQPNHHHPPPQSPSPHQPS